MRSTKNVIKMVSGRGTVPHTAVFESKPLRPLPNWAPRKRPNPDRNVNYYTDIIIGARPSKLARYKVIRYSSVKCHSILNAVVPLFKFRDRNLLFFSTPRCKLLSLYYIFSLQCSADGFFSPRLE